MCLQNAILLVLSYTFGSAINMIANLKESYVRIDM